MAPAKLNISVYAGTQFEMTLTLKDSGGTPIDISGWSFASPGSLKKNLDSTSAADFQAALVTDGTDGKVKVFIPAADTATIPLDDQPVPGDDCACVDLAPTEYIFDIVFTNADAELTHLFYGCASVYPVVGS